MLIRLTQGEQEELFLLSPDQKKKGGFQSLIITLQENYAENNGLIVLNSVLIERIQRYAFGYGNGGWENRLKRIFVRTLGPDLRMAA
jgi:hypothetical protein